MFSHPYFWLCPNPQDSVQTYILCAEPASLWISFTVENVLYLTF